MSTYTYSNNLDHEGIGQLYQAIEDQPNITQDVIAVINTPEGNIQIEFTDDLDDSEALFLNDLVLNFNPEDVPGELTKLQFRNLMTIDEKKLLDNSTNELVVVIRNDFTSAEFIDLSDPAVENGLMALAYAGIVIGERIPIILSNTPPS